MVWWSPTWWGSVRNTFKALDAGVDMIIAQGTEGGGHTGSLRSWFGKPKRTTEDLVSTMIHHHTCTGVKVLEVKVRCSISESLRNLWHAIRGVPPAWGEIGTMCLIPQAWLVPCFVGQKSSGWAIHWQHFIVDLYTFTWFTLHALWNLEDRKVVARLAESVL